jgi:hypothetical protein
LPAIADARHCGCEVELQWCSTIQRGQEYRNLVIERFARKLITLLE